MASKNSKKIHGEVTSMDPYKIGGKNVPMHKRCIFWEEGECTSEKICRGMCNVHYAAFYQGKFSVDFGDGRGPLMYEDVRGDSTASRGAIKGKETMRAIREGRWKPEQKAKKQDPEQIIMDFDQPADVVEETDPEPGLGAAMNARIEQLAEAIRGTALKAPSDTIEVILEIGGAIYEINVPQRVRLKDGLPISALVEYGNTVVELNQIEAEPKLTTEVVTTMNGVVE